MPLWAGAAVVGVGPFALLGLISVLVPQQQTPGSPLGDFGLYVLAASLFTFFESIVIFYTARYLRGEIAGLLNYARKLEVVSSGEGQELNFARLSSPMFLWHCLRFRCSALDNRVQ